MMCVVMTNLGFLVIRGVGGRLDLRVGSHLGFLEEYSAEDFDILLIVVVLVLVTVKVKLAAGFARSDNWWLAEQSGRL